MFNLYYLTFYTIIQLLHSWNSIAFLRIGQKEVGYTFIFNTPINISIKNVIEMLLLLKNVVIKNVIEHTVYV